MTETPRGCFAKIAYGTRAEASKALAKMRERRRESTSLAAYHCEHCGRFHLGRHARTSNAERVFLDKRAKVKRYWQLVRGDRA